jgi:small subunit ribosomal protein S17
MSDIDTSSAGAAEGSASDEAGVEADTTFDVTTSPEASTIRSARKVREGVVTSAGMDKTIVVTITDRVRHAKYNKFVLKSKKLYTHDETNDAGVGDKVRVMETRPMSKSKRWRLVDVLERAR